MNTIMNITNLNYLDFRNINLSFEKGKFYFVVGSNKSGKTTLFRILSSLIFTKNIIRCDKIVLDEEKRKLYIRQIGVVERVNNYSFNYKNVKDEMFYPLLNLGYSISKTERIVKATLNFFGLNIFIDKRISELSFKGKQTLLIMIALLHRPKVLLIDNVLEIYSPSERNRLIMILKELIDKEGMTIINFTSNLQNIMDSDKIILLSNFKIIKETTYNEIFNNDKLFYENNLEIPFNFDVVNKLKVYNLIKDNYVNMKDLVDDIWP